jgi:hypothetical protein
MMARTAAILLVLELSASADPTAESRPYFLAGRQAFQEGRLDVAITSFEAAYRIQPLPGLWFNIAQSYRRKFLLEQDGSSLRRSIDGYRQYLLQSPSGPNRDEATQYLSELTPLLARLAPEALGAAAAPIAPAPANTEVMIVTETEHAQVTLDDRSPGPAPFLAQVEPGEHHAHVEAPGYFPADVKMLAVDGRLIVGEARLTPRPARLSIRGPLGAEVLIDRHPAGALPIALQELPAGSHTVDVVARGLRPSAFDLDLARGSSQELDAPKIATRRNRAAKWLAITSGIVGVFAISGAAVWADADASANSRYVAATQGHWTSDSLAAYEDERARRDSWRITTGVALGVTGGLALTAALLYLTDLPKPPHGRLP